MRVCLKRLGVISVIVIVLIKVVSAASNANTNRGSYRNWNDIDEVTILRPFHSSSYKWVIVQHLETQKVNIPPPSENTYRLAKEVMSSSSEVFTQGLKEKLAGSRLQVAQRSTSGEGLFVRAHLEKLDPGSVAARMWAPGAGAAQTIISGEIVDARTNETLVRFRQERRSVMKLIWQPESIVLSHTLRQIGGDIGRLLRQF